MSWWYFSLPALYIDGCTLLAYYKTIYNKKMIIYMTLIYIDYSLLFLEQERMELINTWFFYFFIFIIFLLIYIYIYTLFFFVRNNFDLYNIVTLLIHEQKEKHNYMTLSKRWPLSNASGQILWLLFLTYPPTSIPANQGTS